MYRPAAANNINWPVQALIGSADKGTVDLAGMLASPADA